jgi:hypothetical protein
MAELVAIEKNLDLSHKKLWMSPKLTSEMERKALGRPPWGSVESDVRFGILGHIPFISDFLQLDFHFLISSGN